MTQQPSHFYPPTVSSPSTTASADLRPALFAIKTVLVLVYVAFTNPGGVDRIVRFVQDGYYFGLAIFVLIWILAIFSTLVTALLPNIWVRLSWSLLLCLSSAMMWGYHHASGASLLSSDVIALWNARHEIGHVGTFYAHSIYLGTAVFAGGMIAMALPSGVEPVTTIPLKNCVLLPLLPSLLIAGIVLVKNGNGTVGMPTQYAPLAMGTLAAAKLAVGSNPKRKEVNWTPDVTARRDNLVLLMDESIRADFIDLTPGNTSTPRLAALRERFVQFGPTASAGICSDKSNALIRFAASRRDLVKSATTSPTIWQYAKKAGYRTVYIDAQAKTLKRYGLMQNFMSMSERETIDGFYPITDAAPADADRILADVITRELQGPTPVFVYANKNGAHFPYDSAYPADQRLYRPTMSETGDTKETRLNSYRNAVIWSVDKFMAYFLGEANLANTTVVYTSDHGQIFDPAKLTHCVVENPDLNMGIVPLMVMTENVSRHEDLVRGSAALNGRASQFQIVPSLLLWMGYKRSDVFMAYDESLTTGTNRTAAFTSGEVFGFFSNEVNWWPISVPAGDRINTAGATRK